MDTAKFIYSIIRPDKSKERFEMILEPLQAMTQLALLSYCPVGTKLSISDNILFIQIPSWKQSIARSYNSDKKNDLIYLFNVIKRFHVFYNFLKDKDDENSELFEMLKRRSVIGLSNLIQTYNKSSEDHLSQTLRMYIQLVENPDSFKEMDDKTNINTVFSEITEKYSSEHFYIIYNILQLLDREPDEYITYLNSLNSAMDPINKTLKKWISDNIIF